MWLRAHEQNVTFFQVEKYRAVLCSVTVLKCEMGIVTYYSLKRGQYVGHDVCDVGLEVHAQYVTKIQCRKACMALQDVGRHFFTVKRT